jgi:hypothetical protein
MTNQNDGGPAFPIPNDDRPGAYEAHPGMTLRDWFAGQALPQAVLDYGEPSMSTTAKQRCDRGNPVLPYAAQGSGTRESIIARQAYRYADAMLAAREARHD